jgi:hypothetical protein
MPDSWRDEPSLLPPTVSCNMLDWNQDSPSPDTLCSSGRPRTTYSGEVAYSLPRRDQIVGSYDTA